MRIVGLAVKSTLWLLLLLLLLIATLLVILRVAPDRLQPVVESGASYYFDRELTIDEIRQVSVSADPTIEVLGFTLANADWAGPEPLLSVDRLEIAFRLSSLWGDGPVIIHRLALTGLQLELLAPAEHDPNWYLPVLFDDTEDDTADDVLFPVIIEAADADDVRVTYTDPDQQVEMMVEQLTLARDPATGMSTLSLGGAVNGMPLRGSGEIGPTDALQSGRDLKLDVALVLGALELKAEGSVADAIAMAGADLVLDVQAPRSRRILDLLGLEEVRDGPLKFEGRIADGKPGLIIDLEGELADFGLGAHGKIEQPTVPDGIDLDVYMDGPSMAEAGAILGIDGFKDVPFDVSGRLQRRASVLKVIDGRLRAAQGQVTLSGVLPNYPEIDDWQADLEATRIDTSVLGTVLGTPQMPQLFCDVQGKLFSNEDGVELVDLEVSDGDIDLVLNGTMGVPPEYVGAELKARLSGKDLTRLQPLIPLDSLPAAPFRLEGELSRDRDAWRIVHGLLQSKGFDLDFSAELDRIFKPRRLELNIGIASEDLPAALREYGVAVETTAPVPLALTGNARLVEDGFELSAIRGELGSLRVTGRGLLSGAEDLAGSSITLAAKGDAFGEVLSAFVEADLPGQPGELELDATYHAPLVSVDRLRARVGPHTLTGRLTLAQDGARQIARGHVDVEGNSTRALLALGGLDVDHVQGPYRVGVDLEISSDELRLNNIDADLVNSHLGGSAHLAFTEVPRLDIDLYSRVLHLPSVWPALAESRAPTDAASSAASEQKLMHPPTRAQLQDRVIPETALPLDWLSRVNGHWRYRADSAWAREGVEARLVVDLDIEGGVLESRELYWEGSASQGWIDLRMDGRQQPYRVEVELASDRIPLLWLLAGRDVPKQQATYRASLSAVGSTVREAAAALDGGLLLRASGAQIDNKGLDLILGDVVGSVLDRLNPFSKTEEFTKIECVAGAARADDGVISIDPGVVARMDKIDIISESTVDLNTEALDINFVTRSRKGLGISAGKAITPYLKIAGNLAHPWLTLDPEAVALSGTAAIATGGLSVLAASLYDRWIATAGNPCDKLYEEILEEPDYLRLLALPPPGR